MAQRTDSYLDQIRMKYLYWFVHKHFYNEHMLKLDEEIRSVENKIESGWKNQRSKLKSVQAKKATKLKNPNLSITQLCNALNTSKGNVKRIKFTEPAWEKYRQGKRGKSQYDSQFVYDLEPIIKGSVDSYIAGPYGLFSILESNNFRQAVNIITSQFLEIISENKGDCDYSKHFQKAKERLEGFLSAPELVRRIDNVFLAFQDCLESAFSSAMCHTDWRVGYENIYSGNWDVETLGKCKHNKHKIEVLRRNLFSNELNEPRYMTTTQATSLLIGYCYIRSKFLGFPNTLAGLLMNDKYFKVLEEAYGIPTSLWLKEAKSNSIIAEEIKAAEKYKDEIYPVLVKAFNV